VKAVAIALLLASAVAHADKHSAALLGVAAKDPSSDKAADAMAAPLRTAAAREYRLVGTAKELEAARVAAECPAIEPRCAAKVGAAVSAEYAIAGELERRGSHVTLVLELVDVRAKQRMRSVRQSGGDPKKLVRAAFLRLVAEDFGALTITANAQSGEVLIDGQVVAGLFEGRTHIERLAKGPHLLSIHARGFRPLDVDVTIEDSTKQTLLLDAE
jgi:hypothetical protein